MSWEETNKIVEAIEAQTLQIKEQNGLLWYIAKMLSCTGEEGLVKRSQLDSVWRQLNEWQNKFQKESKMQ